MPSYRGLWWFSLLIALSACRDKGTPPQSTKSRQEEKKPALIEEKQSWNNEKAFQYLRKLADTTKINYADLKTRFGTITIRLFDNTPIHKANFIYLARRGYFDKTWFYRVSPGHVIQAGNTDEAQTQKSRREIGAYTLPAEALDENLHLSGSVAAARDYQNNASKRSDPYEFYINLGEAFRPAKLDAMAKQYDIDLSPGAREKYLQKGGSPHLDGEHTVFGRVVRGMPVVKKINQVKTDEGEWPLSNIPIEVRLKRNLES